MKNKSNIFNMGSLLILCLLISMFNACDKDDDQSFEKTRLFRPVLNEALYAEGNTIFVDMANLKSAVGYIVEVSRDSFATIDYTIPSDVGFVVIDENTPGVGEELFWNTLYQVRATALEANPEYNSKVSDLGNVRTEVFPSILNSPKVFDVIDIAARVTWDTINDGAPVTGIKVFSDQDLRLTTPLFPETPVTAQEDDAGEAFVSGLSPETAYQIAIYSGDILRGWVNYTTKVADISPTAPGVVDIRADESASAVSNAVASAADGAIILVKRGVTYNLPSTALNNKSITIRAAYGFGEQKAKLTTTGNWNIASGSNIDHIRFIDLEIRGADYGGDYIFNPSSGNTQVRELLFDNCKLGTFRGIFRLRGTNAIVDTYEIRNSVIDSIGGYGILTCDTNAGDPQTATVKNIKLINSTFNKCQFFINTRNDAESLTIEGCTFANVNNYFRFRGGKNVTSAIVIKNSIFGRKWDESMAGPPYDVSMIYEGLAETNYDLGNNWGTADLTFTVGRDIPGLPGFFAGSDQQDLWVDPDNNNFNIKSSGFGGRFTAGDPRWRVKL